MRARRRGWQRRRHRWGLNLRAGHYRRLLERDNPWLTDTAARSEIEAVLRGPYDAYVATVSPAWMAVSFETSVFLGQFCRELQPKRVLDLGSGFSSFVFRRMLPTPGHTVLSMDLDPSWLERTRDFLAQQRVSTTGLHTWDPQLLHTDNRFDLVFYDLGSVEQRKQEVSGVIEASRKWNATLIIDDAHNKAYRRAINRELRNLPCQIYVTWPFTRDRWDRYELMVRDWQR